MQEQNSIQPQESSGDSERQWAMFTHLSALAMLLGIPFGNIIAPLILWVIKKDSMPMVKHEGIESLNFQISMTIYTLVAFLLCFVFVGFILIFPIILANVILVIIASVKISNGESYRYPWTIRFIK